MVGDMKGGECISPLKLKKPLHEQLERLAKKQNRSFSNTVETILLSRVFDYQSLIDVLKDFPDLLSDDGLYFKSDKELDTKAFLKRYDEWVGEWREVLENMKPILL